MAARRALVHARNRVAASTVRRPARELKARFAAKRKVPSVLEKGAKVALYKSRKQAITIGLSEARKKGAKVPKKEQS